MGGAFPFVGRTSERETLDGALADARGGRGRLVLVTGEPGIGKTTLTDAFARSVEAQGIRVAFGRAWEGEGAPAWWIWSEAFRSIGETLALPRTLAGEDARFACMEEIAERVRALPAPAVLVLDDLQSADSSSLSWH
jgi:predicted ATPase